jgi:hypothetical protein
MLTKTEYKLLIQGYMDRYKCSHISALHLMPYDAVQIHQKEHNVSYDIIHNYEMHGLA